MSSSPAQKTQAMDWRTAVLDIVKEISPSTVTELRLDAELVAELGYDSLDLLELLVTLEDALELPSINPEVLAELVRVADVERIVNEAMSRKTPGKEPT